MIEGVPEFPQISPISGFPKIISSSGSTEVLRGVTEKEVILTNPFLFSMFPKFYEHDFLPDTSSTPDFITFLATELASHGLNRVATLFNAVISNRSGSDDTFSFYYWNATTDEIFFNVEDYSVPNKTAIEIDGIIGADKFRDGDTMYFVVYDGILGTHGTEPVFGGISLNAIELTDSQSFAEWLGSTAL